MKLLPEGVNVEYKTGKGKNIPKDFWSTYSAFSNTDGGVVIFGVTEPKKYEYEITGTNNKLEYTEQILNNLNNPEKVSYNSMTAKDIVEKEIDGKKILEVFIKEAPYAEKPVYINNNMKRSYKRQGEANQLLSREEIRYYMVNSQSSIDNQLLRNYSIEDLNREDIQIYRDTIASKSEIDYSSLNDIEFLKRIGAFLPDRDKDRQEYYPTAACLLFFGKYNAILERYPRFQLDYFKRKSNIQSKWNDRVSSGDMNFPEMNIYSFYRAVLPKLYNNIEDKFIQDEKMERTSYVSDMRSAVREAFVNMLMHAYYGEDSTIKVTAYDDYFEFYNSGDMRVSKEQFLMGGISEPRNGVLTNLFRRVGLAEKAGYGGQRILDVAQKNSLKIPEIINESNSTTLRLWKVDFAHSLPKDLSEDAGKVYLYLYENIMSKRKEIEKNLGFSEYKTRMALKELREKAYIIMKGESRATVYLFNYSPEMQASQNIKMLKKMEDIIG